MSQCPSVLFCATQDIYDRTVQEVLPQTPSVKVTLCLDAPNREDYAFVTCMESPDDLANLIYTSGTTCKPKGVELIYSNTVSNIHGVRGMATAVHDFVCQLDCTLVILPWVHLYGQKRELWVEMGHGSLSGICLGELFILEDKLFSVTLGLYRSLQGTPFPVLPTIVH